MTITPHTHKYNHCNNCCKNTPTLAKLHKPARDVENGHIPEAEIDICTQCLYTAINIILNHQTPTTTRHQTTFNIPENTQLNPASDHRNQNAITCTQ